MPNWDPAQYAKFIKDRTQPSVDLACRLEALRPDSILDLGCGPGNSSRVLKDRFPGARVTGADNSEEMLEKARSSHTDIEFINLDANGDLHEVSEKFDIVFSNACIQWLPDHRTLLPKLMTLLKSGGTLAVQIPIQNSHPVHVTLSQLARTERWKDKLSAREYSVLTAEEYHDILAGISDDFEIWETVYCHRMPGIDSIIEWYKGTGLRPYLEQLSPDDAEEFLRCVSDGLRQRYETRINGEILFRFPRLFFTARRK